MQAHAIGQILTRMNMWMLFFQIREYYKSFYRKDAFSCLDLTILKILLQNYTQPICYSWKSFTSFENFISTV
jgi:hypothetical protein